MVPGAFPWAGWCLFVCHQEGAELSPYCERVGYKLNTPVTKHLCKNDTYGPIDARRPMKYVFVSPLSYDILSIDFIFMVYILSLYLNFLCKFCLFLTVFHLVSDTRRHAVCQKVPLTWFFILPIPISLARMYFQD